MDRRRPRGSARRRANAGGTLLPGPAAPRCRPAVRRQRSGRTAPSLVPAVRGRQSDLEPGALFGSTADRLGPPAVGARLLARLGKWNRGLPDAGRRYGGGRFALGAPALGHLAR